MPYKDKQKQKEYQRKWVACRRASYLADKICKHCGDNKNLRYHHLNPNEKESHRIWTWSKKRLEEELTKCIVLCRKCHRKAHRTVKHGTKTMYCSYGCRCITCKAANTAAARQYRAGLKKEKT